MPTPPDILPLRYQDYLRLQVVDGLTGVADGDVFLFPAKATRDQLKLFAERDEQNNATEKEVQDAMVVQGRVAASRFAKLWRALRDLQEGGEVVVENVRGEEKKDFDEVMKVMSTFNVLTRLEKAYPEGCSAAYQCSCEKGQKYGVCVHALVHTLRQGECEIPPIYLDGTGPRRRGKGRPKKRARALETQPGETLADYLPEREVPQRLADVEGDIPAGPPRRSARDRVANVRPDV
jgi:hypothetical protein